MLVLITYNRAKIHILSEGTNVLLRTKIVLPSEITFGRI